MICLLSFLVLAVLVFKYLSCRNKNVTYLHLAEKFKHIPEIKSYQESLPLFYVGQKKQSQAILLLHGYSASPQEFENIACYLEKERIPYYAPLLFGFGLDTLNILKNADKEDWIRDALFAYDVLKEIASEVSVIGHSTGGLLAMAVAKSRKVNNLILSSPNLFSIKRDEKWKKLLNFSLISDVICFLYPYHPKPIRKNREGRSDTLDKSQVNRCFNYQSVPVNSLKAMWALQDSVDIKSEDCEKLVLLIGEHDETIDVSRVVKFFDEKELNFEKFVFENSAHNLFEDYDKCEVSKKILSVINPSQQVLIHRS